VIHNSQTSEDDVWLSQATPRHACMPFHSCSTFSKHAIVHALAFIAINLLTKRHHCQTECTISLASCLPSQSTRLSTRSQVTINLSVVSAQQVITILHRALPALQGKCQETTSRSEQSSFHCCRPLLLASWQPKLNSCHCPEL